MSCFGFPLFSCCNIHLPILEVLLIAKALFRVPQITSSTTADDHNNHSKKSRSRIFKLKSNGVEQRFHINYGFREKGGREKESLAFEIINQLAPFNFRFIIRGINSVGWWTICGRSGRIGGRGGLSLVVNFLIGKNYIILNLFKRMIWALDDPRSSSSSRRWTILIARNREILIYWNEFIELD